MIGSYSFKNIQIFYFLTIRQDMIRIPNLYFISYVFFLCSTAIASEVIPNHTIPNVGNFLKEIEEAGKPKETPCEQISTQEQSNPP